MTFTDWQALLITTVLCVVFNSITRPTANSTHFLGQPGQVMCGLSCGGGGMVSCS